jgi:hypothetical protein
MVSSIHGQGAAQEVDVAGLERDELAPAEAGFDQGLDHQPVLLGERRKEALVLAGSEGARLGSDHLGQLGVVARVVDQDPVLDGADEDRGQEDVVFADRAG